MATLDKIDQLPSSGKETEAGWTFARVATVRGVTGSGMAQLQNAVRVAGIPQLGTPLSSHPSAVVVARTPTPHGGGTFTIRIDYADQGYHDTPDDQSLEVGTSLESVETNTNIEGLLLQVKYNGVWQKAASVGVLRPNSTIRISRTESKSPGKKSQEYVGKVNKHRGFRLAGASDIKRCWLCQSITGSSRDKGKSWQVQYEFAYMPKMQNPDGTERAGWDYLAIYRDESGNVPPDVIDGTWAEGDLPIAMYTMYHEADFNKLNLS